MALMFHPYILMFSLKHTKQHLINEMCWMTRPGQNLWQRVSKYDDCKDLIRSGECLRQIFGTLTWSGLMNIWDKYLGQIIGTHIMLVMNWSAGRWIFERNIWDKYLYQIFETNIFTKYLRQIFGTNIMFVMTWSAARCGRWSIIRLPSQFGAAASRLLTINRQLIKLTCKALR